MGGKLKHRWSVGNNYLAGITAGSWWRLLRENRFSVDPAYWHRAAFITAMGVMNSFCRRKEEKLFHERIAATGVRPPLFILGHWRSGTTLLHNLLASDTRQFAFANTYQVVNPHTFLSTEEANVRRFAWMVPKTRPMDAMELGFHLPQEDEFAPCLMSLRSLYLGISFPRHEETYARYLTFDEVPEHEIEEWKSAFLWFLKKLSLKSPNRLVLKSPPHTARIRLLLQMFPDASFVHIHRNPYDVFQSCRHYYDTATWYSYLQRPDVSRIDDGIIGRYTQLHDAYFRDRPIIPEGRFHEIRYQDLARDPVGEVGRLYTKLGLENFGSFKPALEKQVASLAGYRKNRFGELDGEMGNGLETPGDGVLRNGTMKPEPHTGPKRIAPGPRGHFLLGHLREFRRDVLGLVMESAKSYGDIVRCRLGPQVVHLLNHPDHVGHVLRDNAANYDKNTRSSATIRSVTGDSLLTCNGDFWKRQRRMDQPAFHHRQIAGFADKMTAVAADLLESWRNRGDGPIDIASEMARLTYSIVGKTLFSFDTGKDATTVEKAMRVILPHVFSRLGSVFLPPTWFPSSSNRKFRRSLKDVDEVVYRIIDQHRRAHAEGHAHEDLLGMLLQVHDPDTGEGLNDTQLRNETITFLLAGHETTANALTWIFHLLSLNPESERLLAAEIDEVLGGRTPVLEDVPRLIYTKKVIQEAMRLYPPIWIIERRVIHEDVIAGYTLPAGSAVVISPFALHRHPGFWDGPEEFDPTRFDERPSPAYIPFGAGPRFCIGNEFAMLEAHLIVAMVIQSYQLKMVPGHPVEPMPDITLRPRHGMMMTLHPRQSS